MENFIIGIDISSKTLDICVELNQNYQYQSINNTTKDIRKFFKQYLGKSVVIAMENTGRYNWKLYEVLPEFNFEVYVLNPLHLSKSLGLVRGKDDKTDAFRICSFVKKNKQEILVWKPASMAIKKLKVLLTEREGRIKQKRRLLNQLKDYALMKDLGLDKELIYQNKQSVKLIEQQIEQLEKLIAQTIGEDEVLKEQDQIIQSVPGAGKVLSWNILAKSEGFEKINNPREMACYAGVVPFAHQSGTSVYRKPRVSIFADKTLKSILHLAAMSAIRLDNDFAIYYRRKVEQGKNKMAVLNAIRNKIIHVIFSLVKNKTFFKNRLVVS